MKKSILFYGVFLASSNLFSQALVVNRGADVFIKPGGFVIVKTNSIHNQTGQIENAGEFVIEGDVLNDANLLGGSTTPTGFYRVQGDWINNANVVSNQDTVELFGNNQLITGSQPTAFHNLILSGNTTAVKTQTIDASVSGFLNLNDVELATGNNNMTVLNTANNAIRGSLLSPDYGFVSSLNNGKLIRATDNSNPYFYPLGTPSSTGAPFYFRPIDMIPANAAPNQYGVRLAKDPTAEGFDVNSLDNLLCRVNPLYYHRINHPLGTSPSAIRFYFDAANDNRWTDVGHWETSRWNYTSTATASTLAGFNALQINNWNDFDPQPFALASRKFTVDAGPDRTINRGQTTALTPTISTSAIANINWSPAAGLDFTAIRNPNASPEQTTTYTIAVTDDLGCEVIDSVVVNLRDNEILIPNAFSPNDDGQNDVFRVLNNNIDEFTMIIYNRWGEKVFETTDISEGWDGTFRDVPQDIGVYVWNLVYKHQGDNKRKTMSGNVTLVR